MDENTITIQLFGDFSIRIGDHVISEVDKRSRRTWLTLAYLIYHRNRVVSQKELSDLLWRESAEINNPQGALRNILYQVRSILRGLGEVGDSLVLRSGGGYKWNNELAVEVDIERFDEYIRCAVAASNEDERLTNALKAVLLYEDEFLARMSSELWVRPIAVYYHDLYIKICIDVIKGLRKRNRLKEAGDLGKKALRIDPYNEELYQLLMENCLEMREYDEVASLYDRLSKLYLSDLGIMPSEKTRQLYRDAIKSVNRTAISYEVLQEQLDAPLVGRGAMICDYDFFRYIYNANVRQLERNGVTAHIVLLTLTDKNGGELSARSRDVAMEHLETIICGGLRRTDVVSRCSISQFVLLLPMSNFENSGMVSRRLIKAFFRQYPHSPARIEYSVHTLHPLKAESTDTFSR